MVSHSTLVLLALLIPLTLDTFIISAALGVAGLPKKQRVYTSLVFALFEGVMPAVGVIIGKGADNYIGAYANYVAAAVIVLAGAVLLKPAKEEDEEFQKARLISKTKGIAILYLGLSISIDEVAIGFSLGLLGIPLALAAILIAGQAFLASQAGLWLGDKLSSRFREKVEQLAGVFLVLVGIVLAILKMTHHEL